MKYLYMQLYWSCCYIVFAYVYKSNPLIIIGSTLPLWWLSFSFSKAGKPRMFNLPMCVLLHGPSASAHFRSAVNVQVVFSKCFWIFGILFIYLCIDFILLWVFICIYIWKSILSWGSAVFTYCSFIFFSSCFCLAYLAL